MRLENRGEETVQLRERHWRIFSLSGTLETVRGRGVVGQVRTLCAALLTFYLSVNRLVRKKDFYFRVSGLTQLSGSCWAAPLMADLLFVGIISYSSNKWEIPVAVLCLRCSNPFSNHQLSFWRKGRIHMFGKNVSSKGTQWCSSKFFCKDLLQVVTDKLPKSIGKLIVCKQFNIFLYLCFVKYIKDYILLMVCPRALN